MTWLSSQDSAQSGCTELSGGAPDCVRCAMLALAKRLLSGLDGGVQLKFTGLSGGAPDCPVSQRSAAQSAHDAWLSQRSDGGTGLSGVHRTVSSAPTAPNLQRPAARIGKQSAPDSVRWCTGLSGAPPDRRQGLPSWIALKGS
jgi:hypothetical protein